MKKLSLAGWLVGVCLVSMSGCNGGDDDGGSGGSSGAGGSSGTGGSGGGIFSCETPTDFGCFELQVPPGGLQAATDQYTNDGGTPSTGCPTVSLVGECQSNPHYYYYDGFSGLDQAQQVCEGLGGTWVAH